MTKLAKTLFPVVLGVGLTFIAGSASAGPTVPPPPKDGICHNIGGPEELGANCDGTGTCTYELEDGTIEVAEGNFLGIVIGQNGLPTAALLAHIAHGDGPIVQLFDPPLHLASEIGPHRASNVECEGTRVVLQPPEPGN
ncbi:MAG: hypothetical protein M3436_01010 [Pseudomonadota bacterium]|nr:hypothetical protein [Pseudomonadota bacterium]